MSAVLILALATGVHAALGFGFAMVAMPLLAFEMELAAAAPLVALSMTTVVGLMLLRTRRDMDVRSALRLLAGSLIGIPPGLLLLHAAPETAVEAGLGALLVAFSLWSLARPRPPELRRDAWAYPFGFLAGVFGAAYNVNGPPLAVYGALRRWQPDRFRATLQGFFLPADVLICTAHASSGLWTKSVWTHYLTALPFLVAALLLGLALGRRIAPERFERLLYAAIAALGAILFVESL